MHILPTGSLITDSTSDTTSTPTPQVFPFSPSFDKPQTSTPNSINLLAMAFYRSHTSRGSRNGNQHGSTDLVIARRSGSIGPASAPRSSRNALMSIGGLGENTTITAEYTVTAKFTITNGEDKKTSRSGSSSSSRHPPSAGFSRRGESGSQVSRYHPALPVVEENPRSTHGSRHTQPNPMIGGSNYRGTTGAENRSRVGIGLTSPPPSAQSTRRPSSAPFDDTLYRGHPGNSTGRPTTRGPPGPSRAPPHGPNGPAMGYPPCDPPVQFQGGAPYAPNDSMRDPRGPRPSGGNNNWN